MSKGEASAQQDWSETGQSNPGEILRGIRAFRKAEGDSRLPEAQGNAQLYADQVGLLYRQIPSALLGNVVNSLILTFVLWRVAETMTLLVWLGASLSVTLARWMLYLGFDRVFPDHEAKFRWCRWYLITTLLSGGVWGAGGYLPLSRAKRRPSGLHRLRGGGAFRRRHGRLCGHALVGSRLFSSGSVGPRRAFLPPRG